MTTRPYKNIIKWLTAIMLITSASLAYGSEENHDHGHNNLPSEIKITPQTALKMAIRGNDFFKITNKSNYFDAYQEDQIPSITVVSCADSRVHTKLFGIDPNNNIFIIRNIGNQITTSQGSVDYGVRHLPCKILLIMGHSSCGAIKAAMRDYSEETTGIKSELNSLRAVIAKDKGYGSFGERWAQNVERNVDYQVQQALGLYADKVSAGEIAVIGAIYDFNDIYGKGRGSLVITNVNGETNPGRIMNNPILQKLDNAELVNHVSSKAPAEKW